MENKKNNKGLIAIIIILIICVLGIIGYIIYDKLNEKEEKNNNEINPTSTITTTIPTTESIPLEENIVYDFNEGIEPIAKELEKQLVTSDNIFGLYYDKITINDTENTNFIKFNIRQYILDNNINYKDVNNECGIEITKDNGYVISKDTINKYIQEKYNTTNSYDMNTNEYIHFGTSIYFITSDNDNYIIGCRGQSGDDIKIYNKHKKIETEEDKIYLYDNAVGCHSWNGIYCTKTVDSKTTEDKIFDSNDITENINDYNLAAKYVFDNLLDKTNTYKHTFIKAEDGNYYWYSTEIVK